MLESPIIDEAIEFVRLRTIREGVSDVRETHNAFPLASEGL